MDKPRPFNVMVGAIEKTRKENQRVLTESRPLPTRLKFDDYLRGYQFVRPVVLLTDQDGLSFQEKVKLSEYPRLLCFLDAKKVKDKSAILKRRREAKKYGLQVPLFGFIDRWQRSFTHEQIRHLLERYYVEGYDSFCLAITPDNPKHYPMYKFLLPSYVFEQLSTKFNRMEATIGVDHYYEQCLDLIRSEYGNRCMTQADFLSHIRSLRDFCQALEDGKTLSFADCVALKQLEDGLPQTADITADFLKLALGSLVLDLERRNVISRCGDCGGLFLYRKGKKYCSLLTEHRNCGKHARNQRYYSTRGRQQFRKYRQRTREQRKPYKEHSST